MTKTILCISCYEKGFAFLQQAKAEGWRVLLLTGESLRDAAWPRDVLDGLYFLPDPGKVWNLKDMVKAVSYLARSVKIDRIVALDDYDVEKAALLREHLRVEGMGDTTARNFRDKLAMRGRAKDAGLPIPEFTGVFNDAEVSEFLARVPAPWVLKPRLEANAIGIQKLHSADDVWRALHDLGDDRSNFLLERFIKGEIAHVDSVVVGSKVKFAVASQYGTPPMEVFHGGTVFTTRTLVPGSAEEKALLEVNAKLLSSLGLRYGVSHSEFIVAPEGTVYFLETSARVGGAHIAELVEFSSGINLWREWAKLECAEDLSKYTVKRTKKLHGALMVTLAKQEWPDMSGYDAPEVAWVMKKPQHAGLILTSASRATLDKRLEEYLARFYEDFFMRIPAAKSAAEMG